MTKVGLITEDIRRTPIPLTYDGSIEVLGTVRSGAHLQVAGDVSIYGNVEDAIIEAKGGVIIDGGFLGAGHGRIECEGCFRCRFIQNQRVIAKGNVEVERSAVSSTIFSSGSVVVRGAMVGGEVHAFAGIETGMVGSKRPVMTRIETGLDPVVALRIEELESEAMALTKKRLGLLKNLRVLCDGGSEPKRIERATDLEAAADAIHGDVIAIGESIIRLRQEAKLNRNSMIIVSGCFYPPVELSVCFAQVCIDDEMTGVRFSLKGDQIICEPLTGGQRDDRE